MLALVGAPHIVHVSRIRVKLLLFCVRLNKRDIFNDKHNWVATVKTGNFYLLLYMNLIPFLRQGKTYSIGTGHQLLREIFGPRWKKKYDGGKCAQ